MYDPKNFLKLWNDSLGYHLMYKPTYFKGIYPDQPQDLDKYVELPGVSEKMCQVSYNDGYMEITATASNKKDFDTKIYVGSLDTSTIKAELKDGLLHLTGKVKDKTKHIKLT